MKKFAFLLFPLSLFSFSLFSFFFTPLAVAKTERQLECRVVGISDGDTLTCLQNRKQIKVRLQHIDAPEFSQPFGKRAKQALSQLAFKKQVRLVSTGYDRYQRMLAVVFDERGQNVNLALVEQGMAWAYRETQPIYQQAQAVAQSQRIGLWRDPNPVNPADFRRMKREQSSHSEQPSSGWFSQIFPQNRPLAQPQPSANRMGGTDCSQVLTCRDFATYDEANRYFRQCGSKTMDGNGDGIPCNKLYRKAQRNR